MELEFTADRPDSGGELFIHLDIDGLAALLRAVEAAMSTGRGSLTPRGASATMAGSGSPGAFGKVIVTFAPSAGPSDGSGPIGRPRPDPVPRMKAKAMQG